MKKRDWIFLALIAVLCAVLWLGKGIFTKKGDTVNIYVNSKLYKSVPLFEDAQINVGGTNTVKIENGYVYMESADCPDKLCVKTGKIKDNSHDIICLPNKVRVEVTKKSAIDAVSG